jgi:hypothetical protein
VIEASHNLRICRALTDLGFDASRFSKQLERSLAGATLGEPISGCETAANGRLLGTDEIGGTIHYIYTRYDSLELAERVLYHWHGQLALIRLKYRDSYRGGWNFLVAQARDNYGPPSREKGRRAIWNDGRTVLILDDEPATNITANLSDLGFALKYLDLQKSLAPTLN